MHHTTPLITTLVGGLVLAFLLGMLANKLRISPLVGYLAAGVMAGPFTPGFVADTNLAPELAELGVILLMFGVGLHFSFKDLMSVKKVAIPGAIAQMTVATLMGWGLAHYLAWPMMNGIVFGLCLSTASTVVLLRALEERQLLDSQRGRIAIGWLIVEDLVMVLALVLLPAFAGVLEQGSADIASLASDLLLTLGKVIAFMLLMMLVGRRVIPWVLARSAATGSRELFTLAVLALALGIAFGAVEFFDVSFALGAFFAGMVLNESELSHRAAHDTLPLRDAFAVLFFVSVGMLFDPQILLERPFAILGALAIILLGKSIAAWLIVRLLGNSKRTALTIAVSLAQIGEFSFILAGLGMSLGVLSKEGQNLVLATAILSIMLNPILFSLSSRWIKQEPSSAKGSTQEEEDPPQVPPHFCSHAIVVGYGRVGKLVCERLQAQNIDLVVMENDRSRIAQIRQQGLHAVYGNAANPALLELMKLDCARWLVLTIPNGFESAEIASKAREKVANIQIFARAHHDEEVNYLTKHGCDQVVMGEREIALGLASAVLSSHTAV